MNIVYNALTTHTPTYQTLHSCTLLLVPKEKKSVPSSNILLESLNSDLFILCSSSAGVADGVGGWRDYGIDPSQFPGQLMKACERIVKNGNFTTQAPVQIIATSYQELLENKSPLIGKIPTA